MRQKLTPARPMGGRSSHSREPLFVPGEPRYTKGPMAGALVGVCVPGRSDQSFQNPLNRSGAISVYRTV